MKLNKKKSIAAMALLIVSFFGPQSFAVSKTVNISIARSTLSRSDGTTRGSNAYVQLLNTGGTNMATNIVDN